MMIDINISIDRWSIRIFMDEYFNTAL